MPGPPMGEPSRQLDVPMTPTGPACRLLAISGLPSHTAVTTALPPAVDIRARYPFYPGLRPA
jgi:hypothetical protein